MDPADLDSPRRKLSNGGLGIVAAFNFFGNYFFVGSYRASDPAVGSPESLRLDCTSRPFCVFIRSHDFILTARCLFMPLPIITASRSAICSHAIAFVAGHVLHRWADASGQYSNSLFRGFAISKDIWVSTILDRGLRLGPLLFCGVYIAR